MDKQAILLETFLTSFEDTVSASILMLLETLRV